MKSKSGGGHAWRAMYDGRFEIVTTILYGLQLWPWYLNLMNNRDMLRQANQWFPQR